MPSKQENIPLREDKVYRPPDSDRDSDRDRDRNENELNIEDLIGKFKNSLPKIPGFKGGSRLLIFFAILIIVLIWVGSGVYTVDPSEQAVVRVFGKFTGIREQGLRWNWPSPIGRRDIIAVTKTRRMELGFRSSAQGGGVQAVPAESGMITGDENIVEVQAVVQYRVSDPRAYLFNVGDPGEPERQVLPGQPDGKTLRDVIETALRQVVGARNIDDVLTTEKEVIQTEVLNISRRILAEYNAGIDVQQVLLQNVNPPSAVQDAFEDVVKAREDRDRIVNLAEAYQAEQIPKAEGESAKIIEAAEAFKQGRLAKAQGEALGFESLLEGYNKSPEITRARLHLETMELIFGKMKKIILTNPEGVLPLLPLNEGLNLSQKGGSGE